MISQATKEQVLSASKIEEVIGDYIGLKKKGVNYIGCCPFHNEKTPSFVVSPTKSNYTCYGCGKYGDVISFVMEHEAISYPEAVKVIAEKYKIPIDYHETTAESAEFNHKESLKSSLKWASKFYNSNTQVEAASKYFEQRVISEEMIEVFHLGFSLPEWNTLEKGAAENGYGKEILFQAGLIRKGDKNTYDYFRNRVMFPFFDVSGNVIGFTGRDISGVKDIAKYLNSPDTDLFNKGKIIYGLFQAKRQIHCLISLFVEVRFDQFFR